MTHADLKQALVSILIGATVAFLTTLLQGLIGLMPNVFDTATGSIAGGGYYLYRTLRVFI